MPDAWLWACPECWTVTATVTPGERPDECAACGHEAGTPTDPPWVKLGDVNR